MTITTLLMTTFTVREIKQALRTEPARVVLESDYGTQTSVMILYVRPEVARAYWVGREVAVTLEGESGGDS